MESEEITIRRRKQQRTAYKVPKKAQIGAPSMEVKAQEDESIEEQPHDLIDEVLERIAIKAENAAHMGSEMMHKGSEMAENVMHKGSEMAENVMHKGSEMMHKGSEMAENVMHKGSEMVHRFEDAIWKAIHFEKLPNWMKDNEHLHFGHRPQLGSFAECFKSIFRIHTETGNIWTHLIGFVAFVVVTIVFYVKPLCATCNNLDIDFNEKLVFAAFFVGAILCLACSTLFHTLSCHSEWASAVFSRLDYAGIAFLIVGSTIPWLYYGFYCQYYARLTYMVGMSVFGLITVVVTMLEKFSKPDYRAIRAFVFIGLGMVGSVPMFHYLAQTGFHGSIKEASFHCTLIMAALYLTGAGMYAARIPERFMPGKCDIWFQSHQIFHVLVIAAAFVHYHGISEMAMYRLKHDPQCNLYYDNEPELVINNAGAIY